MDFYGNNSWYPYSKLPLLQYSFKNLLLIIIDILSTSCNLINSSVTQSVWAAKQLRGFHCYWQLVPFCTLLSSILFPTLNRHTTPQFPRMLPFQQKFFLILKFCGRFTQSVRYQLQEYSHKRKWNIRAWNIYVRPSTFNFHDSFCVCVSGPLQSTWRPWDEIWFL